MIFELHLHQKTGFLGQNLQNVSIPLIFVPLIDVWLRKRKIFMKMRYEQKILLIYRSQFCPSQKDWQIASYILNPAL